MTEIYKITCQICNKIYVGKHKVNNRLLNNYLGSGKKQLQHLKEHGTKNQIKQILLYCEDADTKYYEETIIKLYDATNIEIGLNISKKSKGIHEHSVKSIEKMRQSHVGFKHSEETKKLWSEQRKGKNNSNYGRDLSGKNNPMWGKHHKKETKQLMKISKIGKKQSYKTRQQRSVSMVGKNNKDIICFDINNNFISKFDSLTMASKKLNLNISKISQVLTNNRNHTGGYKFEYVI